MLQNCKKACNEIKNHVYLFLSGRNEFKKGGYNHEKDLGKRRNGSVRN